MVRKLLQMVPTWPPPNDPQMAASGPYNMVRKLMQEIRKSPEWKYIALFFSPQHNYAT